jgi:O-antigen/teichoic acid export membrane protein
MKYFGVIKKVSFVSAGNIINAGFGLVFVTACAKVLSVSDFGKYALLTTALVFMSKIVDFGSNSVFVAEWLKSTERPLLLRRFYALKIALFAAALPLSLLTLYFLGFSSLPIIMIFLLGLFSYSVNVTLFAIFQSAEMFTRAVLLNTLPAFSKALLGTLILLNFISPSFTAVYATFCISMVLCTVLYFFVPSEFKLCNLKLRSQESFLSILRSSVPAGVSQLISQGWSAISNTVVKMFKSFSDVGIFYLADKVANIFNLVSLSIFTVVLPQNARRRKENIPHDLKETAVLAFLVLILAVAFVSVSGIFIDKLFGDKFSGSLLILDILIISAAISAVHSFMENYFYIHDSTDVIMYISLIKLFTFVSMALILAPSASLKGVALSQLVASVVGLLLVSSITIKYQLKKV